MIELRGVTKSVPSGSGILTILHPLDLIIPHGAVAAITGPSGSGKSTLLGLVAGLDAPTAGSIYIDGVDITALGEDAPGPTAWDAHRLCLPVLSPPAVAHRLRERPGADGDRRRP